MQVKYKKEPEYDIVIVGAGPAGATLARLLSPVYRILILDKKPIEKEISMQEMKCCGGLLSESAQKVMAEMGLNLPTDILIAPQTFALKVMDLGYPVERSYQKHYFNMDRAKFESWLIGQIPDHVEKRERRYVKEFHRCQNGVELIVKNRQTGQEERITTHMAVAADGANSIFRKKLYPRMAWPGYVALQEWYENDGGIDYYAAITDESITDFYSWLIPKGNALILGSALNLDDENLSPSERFRMLKSKLEERGLIFGKKILREGCEIIRPINNHLTTGNRKIALIGEAGGFISPSSAEGFSYAFRTARALAEAINEKGIDQFATSYARNCQNIKLNVLARNIKAIGMYQPLSRRLALKTGFGAVR